MISTRTPATLLAGGLSLALLGGCGGEPSPSSGGSRDGGPTVYVVNYPLQYFAERIGGEAVSVVFPDMTGDPAYWEPEPGQVGAYQSADMILLNGAGYANWVSKVSLPSANIVDTGRRNADRFIPLEDAVTHSHGPGGEHAHGGVAFTTWLDPQLAIEQARAIRDAFVRKWPDKAGGFEDRFDALKSDLVVLDEELIAVAAGRGDVPLVMSHPVFQYLERRYGLNARSVHWEPDALPDDRMVADLEELLAVHPARWMVWEDDPLPEAIAWLQNRGLGSVVFDPCANRPESGDFLTVMRSNVEELRRVFGS